LLVNRYVVSTENCLKINGAGGSKGKEDSKARFSRSAYRLNP
jgi:hypothetical protein